MITKKFECKQYYLRAYCECGGEFKSKSSDGILMSWPPRFPHQCDKCGKTETFFEVYPALKEEIGEEIK